MKLPGLLTSVLPKKPETVAEAYLTCILHKNSVDACVWDVGPKKKSIVLTTDSKPLVSGKWSERREVCRDMLSRFRTKIGEKSLNKVILGLPSAFLNESGDIEPSIRRDLHSLLKELSLHALGFVSLQQAIIYTLRQEEGIPPNVILLDTSENSIHLYLYKIGQLTGEKILDTSNGVVQAVENCLTGFTDVEVLPSRMLLFGGDQDILEASQAELLKHPWQNRANFLHFPKIEIYAGDKMLESVSVAGANELVLPNVAEAEDTAEATEDDVPEAAEKPVVMKEDHAEAPTDAFIREDSNVQEVTPDELGFAANKDVLVEPEQISEGETVADSDLDEETREAIKEKKQFRLAMRRPALGKISLPSLGFLRILPKAVLSSKASLVAPVALLFLAGVVGMLYWFVPHATITVYVQPRTITESQDIIIDPATTSVDPEDKIVPGKLQEKSLSGDKTIPVSGKKKVGDPARGSITIYNKTPLSRTFKKGTVVTSGSLQFALDADVQVASASENLASSQLTYGKATTTITALSIGPESNMPGNTEFAFKDVSSSIATARNEQPLTGGTSRDVTVVTRSDQDALVKLLSDELTEKAKSELIGGLTLSDTLIEQTVKTAIAQKTFSQELNEEATELTGSVTVNATGITYAADDVLAFLKDMVNSKVPPGYQLLADKTTTDIGEVAIAKDGKITTKASITSIAAPQIDTEVIEKESAGKTVEEITGYLEKINGVGGLALTFRNSPIRNRLPVNESNISVSVAVQE